MPAVLGTAELRWLAAQLRDVANRGMEAELRHELAGIYDGLQSAIKANAAAMLPSGYAPVMSSSVRVGVTLKLRGAFSARAVVSAVGGKGGRDVRAINRGQLKHPLFGQRTYIDRSGAVRSGWFTTTVPPGFVDRAAADIPREAHRRAVRAVKKVIVRLGKG